jgi:thioredoxin-like negative regulator of GroEL
MGPVTASSLQQFLEQRPFSVVHIDAPWDGYSKIVADKIATVEQQFSESVSFGYVDCDQEQDYARRVGVVNVPSIAYYRGVDLLGLLIGIKPDIPANIEQLKRGGSLDETNRHSRG